MDLHKLLDLTDVQRQQIRFRRKDQVLSWNPAIFHVLVQFVCRSVDVLNVIKKAQMFPKDDLPVERP